MHNCGRAQATGSEVLSLPKGLQVDGLQMNISGCLNVGAGGGFAIWELRYCTVGPELSLTYKLQAGPASTRHGEPFLPLSGLVTAGERPDREQVMCLVSDTLSCPQAPTLWRGWRPPSPSPSPVALSSVMCLPRQTCCADFFSWEDFEIKQRKTNGEMKKIPASI